MTVVDRLAVMLSNRREFLALAGASAGALAGAAPPRQPNIVLILADDLGFSDIAPYGGEIDTPHLTALARDGVRLRQFYNTARCCPTRASLLTGLYSHQAGVGHMVADDGLPGYRGDLSRNAVTIAEVLKPAGYKTMMCGKWHVTPPDADSHNWPVQRGFDKYYGTIAGSADYFNPITLTRDNTPISVDPQKPFYYTDALGEQAAAYIHDHKRESPQSPFFLYAAFTAPHWPLHALQPEIDKYADRYQGGWDKLREERHQRQLAMGLADPKWGITARDSAVPAWADSPDKEWHARRMAIYAAQVDRLDQNIGKILAALRETGLENDTLVMFMSDNGGCAEELARTGTLPGARRNTVDGRAVRSGNIPEVMPGREDSFQSYGVGWANASNTPFRLYKHWEHEGGISSPFIARWPARITAKKGTFLDQTGHVADVMATCVDIANAKYPATFAGHDIQPAEGRSLAPALTGGRPVARELYWEHEGNRAIRVGNWKLASKFPGDWELFDIARDRTERNDLAARFPARVKEMTAKWDRWAARANVVPWADLQARRKAKPPAPPA